MDLSTVFLTRYTNRFLLLPNQQVEILHRSTFHQYVQ
jgi:hypothetical protein